ncbi:non-ribosomal peptide synthetase [Streptomyces sp. NBC_01217]|uniref:non-ribosomal peptide synthetase n=1 Tax=Streptomyces sp. NBC_01217 TaxID=2903779 RepID=UPI002E10C128|nr:non-ribosomal peptide synthetase [Streptomyces sp. NBC_01217]WSQ61173.1 amino acid adenylation domain-containing protein [Streptomyces sp. NBC_01217]
MGDTRTSGPSPERIAFERMLLARAAAGKQAARTRPETLPASFGQERMWLSEQLDPEASTETTVFVIGLRGDLDVPALRGAITDLGRRHEVLRTVVAPDGDRLVQRVLPPAEEALPVLDLPPTAEAEAVEAFARQQLRRKHDLATEPPVSWSLLRRTEREHHLVLRMHHMAADGWSEGVLNRELSLLYRARATKEPARLPELAIQYADFAIGQRQRQSGAGLERGLSYWRRRLSGAPAAVSLPFDRTPDEDSGLESGTSFASIPGSVVTDLEKASATEGASGYMALLAAFAVTLWRGSGQQDLVIGSPVAGRDLPETESLIGVFINTLPMRVEVRPGESFRALLRRVREATLDDLGHAEVPFERVVEATGPSREPGRQPLVQVMFQLDNTDFVEPEFPGLAVSYRQLFAETSALDLTVSLGRRGPDYAAVWKYRSGLLDETTLRLLQDRFLGVLRQVAAQPDAPLNTLELFGDRERELLFPPPPASDREALPTTFLHAFEQWARRTPDRPAVRFGEEELSYAALDARVNRLAHRLRELGAGPETLIGLCVERGVEALVALLAVLKADAAYVPLDPRQPAARLAAMLEDAPLSAVLATEAHQDALPGLDVPLHLISVLEAEAVGHPETGTAARVAPDNLAYVIFTSGSTGRPKGVAVTHAGLANYLLHERNDFLDGPPGRRDALVATSLAFDLVLTGLLLPLVAGGCVTLLPEGRELERMCAALESADAPYGLIKVTPSLLDAIDGQLPPGVTPAVRLAVVGGEKLDSDLVARWRRRCPDGRVVNHYGPTETVIACAAHEVPAGEIAAGTVPIGVPMADIRLHVLDRDGAPLAVGTPGELYVGGVCLARGYIRNPRATAERFVPDPFTPGERLYRTGDLVRLRPDGLLEYLGRIDEQVKIRGYRVEPGEIAAVLRTHPAVSAAAVISRREPSGDLALVAYPVLVPGSGATAAELHAHLAERLPDYLVPRDVVLLERLPLTANGKLDRAGLPEPGSGDRMRRAAIGAGPGSGGRGHVAPRTPVEQSIASIWSEVLGVANIGVHDDFFALGGHSLLAARLVARIRQAFPQVPADTLLRDLLRRPTVAEFTSTMGQLLLAAAMDGGTGKAADTIAPADRTRPQPLTPAQEGLWLLERLRPGTYEQVVPLVLDLEGPLDRTALAEALVRVVRRHEAFRMRFAAVEGHPAATVLPTDGPAPELAEHDVRSPEAAQQLVRELIARPFDLAAGPLLRADLVRTGPEHHILCMTMHHIISDAWSCRVLLRDLAACYTERTGAEAAALPPLPVQLLDHMAWQRGRIEDGSLNTELAYWREALAGLESLRLPLDRPRPAQRSGAGASVELRIPSGAVDGLTRLAGQERATPAMVLLAAWQVVLHGAAAGQEEVTVGTTAAVRVRPETEDLVGFLLNMLVIRGDLSGRPSFRTVVGRVRDRMLQAYAHQEIPLDELVRKLAPPRQESQPPFFQVLFDFDHTDDEAGRMAGLHARALYPEIRTAKYDLALSLRLHSHELTGELTYDQDVFDHASAEHFTDAFQHVLERIAADADLPLTDLAADFAPEWTRPRPEPAPTAGRAGLRATYTEPASDTERAVAEIWGEALELDRVGADDNFFHQGGHSLLAMRVVERMREAFDVDLPTALIFEAPTPRSAAALVEAAVTAELDLLDDAEVQRLLDGPAGETDLPAPHNTTTP